jgi:hypothetical protein
MPKPYTITRMLTMQKTVDIPRDRHIHLDLTVPEDVPYGNTQVVLVFAPSPEDVFPKTTKKPTLPEGFTPLRTLEDCKKEAAEKTAKRIAEGRNPFKDLQEGGPLFGGIDGVEFQRRIRDEWPDYWEDSPR